MVHSDFGSDSLELCSVLALSLSTAGGIILLLLGARVYLWTVVLRFMGFRGVGFV